jgi:hypothetical protein
MKMLKTNKNTCKFTRAPCVDLLMLMANGPLVGLRRLLQKFDAHEPKVVCRLIDFNFNNFEKIYKKRNFHLAHAPVLDMPTHFHRHYPTAIFHSTATQRNIHVRLNTQLRRVDLFRAHSAVDRSWAIVMRSRDRIVAVWNRQCLGENLNNFQKFKNFRPPIASNSNTVKQASRPAHSSTSLNGNAPPVPEHWLENLGRRFVVCMRTSMSHSCL